jgi:flagellar biogenesis protein FliO
MYWQAAAPLTVLLLLCGSVVFLRRKGLLSTSLRPGPAARAMQTVQRLSLTNQHSLHLVRIGERQILVAVSPHSCNILDFEAGSQSQPDKAVSGESSK